MLHSLKLLPIICTRGILYLLLIPRRHGQMYTGPLNYEQRGQTGLFHCLDRAIGLGGFVPLPLQGHLSVRKAEHPRDGPTVIFGEWSRSGRVDHRFRPPLQDRALEFCGPMSLLGRDFCCVVFGHGCWKLLSLCKHQGEKRNVSQ